MSVERASERKAPYQARLCSLNLRLYPAAGGGRRAGRERASGGARPWLPRPGRGAGEAARERAARGGRAPAMCHSAPPPPGPGCAAAGRPW